MNRLSQKDFVLNLLRQGPQSTKSLRDHGIYHPAGRVKELRTDGCSIDTVWFDLKQTHRGTKRRHTIAKYVLQQRVTQ